MTTSQSDVDIPTTDREIRPDSIICGDAFELTTSLQANSVDSVVTSPPYWGLRDYQITDQFGIEDNADEYVDRFASLAVDLKDVVADTGSLWLNLGDTYNGTSVIRQAGENPNKGDESYTDQLAENRAESGVKRRSAAQFDLTRQNRLLIPERVAMAIQQSGWILRDRIIWAKPNPKPEGRVSTRLTNSHEVILRFVQQESHTFYRDRLSDPVDVWTIPTADSDHPAPMPAEIARRCIRTTTDNGDTILDPFCGSGTVCDVARSLNRQYIGFELNPEFVEIARGSIGSTPEYGLSQWVE